MGEAEVETVMQGTLKKSYWIGAAITTFVALIWHFGTPVHGADVQVNELTKQIVMLLPLLLLLLLLLFKPSNLQTFKPSNLQTFKLSNLQTFKPSNLQTFKPSKQQQKQHQKSVSPTHSAEHPPCLEPMEKFLNLFILRQHLRRLLSGRISWKPSMSCLRH